MATIVIFLFLLFQFGSVESASCDFSGQCVYNIKVHHCNQTTTKSVRDADDNCDCNDLEIVQGETYNLQNSLGSLETEFNNLVKQYQATKSNLQQKQQQLENAIAENKKLESKIQSVDYLQNKTTKSVTRQTNNWNTEKSRLQSQITQSIKDLQTCRAAVSAANTDQGHGGKTDSASSNQISESFCGFEDSGLCGYKLESGSRWSRHSSTSSSTTGPKQDHTFGTPHGHYMMQDSHNAATSSRSTHNSKIDSPQYPKSSTGYCIKFWYNMHGKDTTFLKVYAKVNGGLGYPVYTKTGEVDSDWHQASITLDYEYTSHPFQIVFETETHAYYTSHYSGGRYTHTYYKDQSNTAIDDVSVYNTSCSRLPKTPTGSHVRQNGSETSYYTFHAKPMTWYEAKEACRKENAKSSLVSINSQAEQDYLVQVINGDENLSNVGSLGFYTSGSDERNEHHFEWTDSGSPYPVTFTKWRPGQPNNVGGNQDCLLLQYSETNYEWGDVDCAEKHPYICLPKTPTGSHVWQNGSETSYYTFHAKPMTWYEAKEACRKENARSSLVSINSQAEQDYLVQVINGDENLSNVGSLGFYTSGSDERNEHHFEWTDSGSPYPVTFTKWRPGQPNNVGGNQDCLLLQYSETNYEWGDVDCAEKHPYICEFHTN